MSGANVTSEELHLAEPDQLENIDVDAWYMDESSEDQRLPHRKVPNVPCSPQVLRDLGIVYWKMDPLAYPSDPKLKAIRKVRGYSYEDCVEVSPSTLPNYEEKIKMFYEEHIHTDEEIRYMLAGSGYFDVRDLEEHWIRIHTKPGDLIVLPEGIYHRFTLDENNYAKALRLFVGEPVWTPVNRVSDAALDNHASRRAYLSKVAAS